MLIVACSRRNPAYVGLETDDAGASGEEGRDAAGRESVVEALDGGREAGPLSFDAAPPPDLAAPPDGAAPADLAGPGQIMGSIGGVPFKVAAAYRIGKPASASMTVIFLLESPATCADISAPKWDVALGASQILELHVDGMSPGVYDLPGSASANYQRHTLNPDASGGLIGLSQLNASGAVGNFYLTFGTDRLSGSFDAAFCAAGVEP